MKIKSKEKNLKKGGDYVINNIQMAALSLLNS